jgi:hypothetical protein
MLLFSFRAGKGCPSGIGRGWVLDLGGVHTVVILMVVGARIRILIEIHQDILNLGLFRGVHNHNYRLGGGCSAVSIHCAGGRLMADEFVACEIVLCVGTAIVGVESLRGGAGSCLLSPLFG